MTQICLTLPAIASPGNQRLLAEALAATSIAAVVITPDASGAIAPDAALPLISAAQKAGAAALIYSDAQLARVLRADGVHLPWSLDGRATVEEAREILGKGAIIGADAGSTRHDAMELGELGVDYVAFGIAAGPEGREDRDSFVAWWAEIFEIPVVALGVATGEEAELLAAAGADFVSITLGPDDDAGTILADVASAISATSTEPVV